MTATAHARRGSCVGTLLPARPRGDICEKLMHAEDVAEMLGMSKDWVYAEARAGRIPHVKLGRYTRFRAEAIENWIRECERGNIVAAN